MKKRILSQEDREQLAEIGRQLNEAFKPARDAVGELTQTITDAFPWMVCEFALEAAEEGDTEFIDEFAQTHLGLGPCQWVHAEAALREGIKYWRAAQEPVHYVQKVAHKKRRWESLDVDYIKDGMRNHGSIYRKRKASWSREPRAVLSLDVMLEQESRRSETDKEAWLDNNGILENEEAGVMVAGEASRWFELEDPYEHQKGKKGQWIREAKYIQKKFARGYHTETFTMRDEQEGFIMSSFIPRLKRDGPDPALVTYMGDNVEANADIEAAVVRAGLRSDDVKVAKAWGLRPREMYFEGAEWNQYRPGWFEVHMAKPDILIYLGWQPRDKTGKVKGNGTPSYLKPDVRMKGKVVFETPYFVTVKGASYRECFSKRRMSAKAINALVEARLSRLDGKRVEASMKRIKRAVKNKKLVE